jgi:hypothetical protein
VVCVEAKSVDDALELLDLLMGSVWWSIDAA